MRYDMDRADIGAAGQIRRHLVEAAGAAVDNDNFPAWIDRRYDLIDIIDRIVDENNRSRRVAARRINSDNGVSQFGRRVSWRRMRAVRIRAVTGVVTVRMRGLLCVGVRVGRRMGVGCCALLRRCIARIMLRVSGCCRCCDSCPVKRYTRFERAIRYAGRKAPQQLINALLGHSCLKRRRTDRFVHHAIPDRKSAPDFWRNTTCLYCDIYSFLNDLFPTYYCTFT